MQMRLSRTLLSAMLVVMPIAGIAAEQIPASTFAKHSTISKPRLSPDGQHIAVRMDGDDGAHALVVFKIADMSRPVSMLRLPRYQLPADFLWTSNTRLIIEKGREFGSLDKPLLTGEIIAADLDGKHQDYLYGYEANSGFDANEGRRSNRGGDHGWAEVEGIPEPSNGHFYMTAHSWDNSDKSMLYDVDADSGARHLIGDIGIGGMEFMVGRDGKAHYAYGRNADFNYVVYHRVGASWAAMGAEQVGGSFAPISSTPDGNGIYASYAPDGGPTSLVQESESGGERKMLAVPVIGEVDTIEWTAIPRQPFATTLATGIPRTSYIELSSPASKLHRALSQKFAGSLVHFVNFSDDGGELLFGVANDHNPGTFYLIDTRTYKVQKLFDVAPWIDPNQMAERRPLMFKTSDGTTLEAILTIPKNKQPDNLPMVLMPHGGPTGVRDDWFFEDDAQFLASRGYLVLQVNYRGSSGRGADFQEAAYRKWGTRVQQDLIEGVKWAIAQHFADPDRICIYGGSFGGYSALMAPIRAPGLFKCAVGYAGIYDLGMMYDKGDIRESESGRNYLKVAIGEDAAELDSNSPAKLAGKIDVPVLLIHGEEDQRAPFAQFKAMRAALDEAHKPYETLTKPKEGHGFYNEKNNVELYDRLQAFLEKYIGKGA
ncbi:alpha/beta hydrolase family protein [Dyella sp.]|jgi:dipeptidyl aminopeptidase/acylaminoacyl peptidase|uniref:alpha/beta hydrolase family protein n=1 Tax=Dyella sp. TaxID=1869338 RepID=UPI002D778F9B|nr:prolyl oligopeptidase family serine peptidase [Dyella sp.]HET6433226.1 prolyl oligopeptidase family serine peptidase [Dyella sp.]